MGFNMMYPQDYNPLVFVKDQVLLLVV